jgi:hypothetical protein
VNVEEKNLKMIQKQNSYLAFAGHRRIAAGSLSEVGRAVRLELDAGETAPISVFDASTSRYVDLDLRGTPDVVAEKAAGLGAWLEETSGTEGAQSKPGPGRPKLGVVGREVTLLPRHWDWLSSQPGGASVTIRKLVEAARKQGQGTHQIRQTQDIAHRFMYTLAGDLPGIEEAARALYAWDLERLKAQIEEWPKDVREHVLGIVERTG